jgi:threonine dehydrogenase-like Zn-dependent dehydrogenase
MNALLFRHDVPRYLASRSVYRVARRLWSVRLAPLDHVRLPLPEPAAADWVRLGVRLAGICGTDLNLVTGRDSLYLEPEASYPFVPGHELVGEIDGDRTRVVVWSVLGCRARGTDPACRACRLGWEGLCERRTGAWPGPGLGIGFNRETGGGWAETCLAHRSQLWTLPHTVSDADAVLLDPAATALAAVLRTETPAQERTLVIGGGTIGLLVAHLHANLGRPGACELIVRHAFQRDWAARYGYAATVLRSDAEFRDWASARGMSAQRVTGYGWVFRGVFDRVIDAAGSQRSVRWGLAATRPGGRLVSVAAPTTLAGIDPTPLWYREITWRGIYVYGPVPWEGESVHPFAVLLPRLASGSLVLRGLLTHTFPLADYVQAIRTALTRDSSGAIKVAFTPAATVS